MPKSIVKDPALAPEGQRKIRWVEQHAPVLNALFKKYLAGACTRCRKRLTPPSPAPGWSCWG